MGNVKILMQIAFVLVIVSCNRGNHSETVSEMSLTADSTAIISSTAATMPDDSAHQFIRTAELKFRVISVIQSTYDIEATAAKQGGYITYTKLGSNIENISTIKISSDSSLETTRYTVSNTIILRIPNTKLDTTLKEISKNIDFLNYRIIKADNVALQILSNILTNKRADKSQMRLTDAVDKKGKKLNAISRAEDVLSGSEEQADMAKLNNLSLNDRIQFSTINLILYQRESVKRELVSNDKNIEEYQPGLGKRISEAFVSGWNILESFFVFLVQIWSFLVIILIAVLLFRKYNNKTRK